jgi:hypothetical protein
MKSMIAGLGVCALGLLLGGGASVAAPGGAASVSFGETVVRGDTLECAVSVSGAEKTRVVDLMFRVPGSLRLLSWEDGEFFASPLRIGPTFDEGSGCLLVALAVRGRQAVDAQSGCLGTLRFVRTGNDTAGISLMEATLVDENHGKHALVSPDCPVKPAPRYAPAVRMPVRFALHVPAPNPASPGTVVSFDVPNPGAEVSIRVYDVNGRLVRSLVEGQRAAGYHSAPWDLRNDGGRPIAPGVYFCRMEAGSFRDTKKVVLLE